jgi:polyphosphate kinase
MIKNILSISGKPGLYKLVSRAKNMLIVESIIDKKRFPIYDHEKVVSLADIAIYTDGDDKPLSALLEDILKKENGAAIALDAKKATNDELRQYLATVLPNFDQDRVYPSDIKKLILWYNLLVQYGITDFHDESLPAKETEEKEEAAPAADAAEK